ncbi:MAG TPA: hypothetical protein VLL08_20050, partial [Kineosporiaceae bacterium]|nr:hypothetical protein [Kineosporiaceae bacterium]
MDEVLRGVAFLACVGLFVFGVTRLVKRFRAAESFALRFVIVASSLLWLVFVVPGLAVTFVSPTNQLLAVVTTIAIWPFFALGAAR